MAINYREFDLGNGLTLRVPNTPRLSPEHVAALQDAFARVQNTEHWKGAIDATLTLAADVAERELALVAEAIEFFTATEALITHLGENRYRVIAPGYWAGPAN